MSNDSKWNQTHTSTSTAPHFTLSTRQGITFLQKSCHVYVLSAACWSVLASLSCSLLPLSTAARQRQTGGVEDGDGRHVDCALLTWNATRRRCSLDKWAEQPCLFLAQWRWYRIVGGCFAKSLTTAERDVWYYEWFGNTSVNR